VGLRAERAGETELIVAGYGHEGQNTIGGLESAGYVVYLFDPYSGLPSAAPPGVLGDNMIAVPRESELPEAVYRPWPVGA
jgi:hypothetical protein